MIGLTVRYGIPAPVARIMGGLPVFKRENATLLKLSDFPRGIQSGGLSDRISESEMMMIQTCRPARHRWKDPGGRIMKELFNVNYSFLGHFPGEIDKPGIYRTEIIYQNRLDGILEYEVT